MSRKYPRTPPVTAEAFIPSSPIVISDPAAFAFVKRCEAEALASSVALNHATTNDGDPMPKIQFTSVTLHKEVPRLDAGKGRATHSTTFFDDRAGVGIEYDPATCLVRISMGPAAVYVPREGVERFGPTVADAKAEADARAAVLAEQAAANAKAAAEAEATAQQPA